MKHAGIINRKLCYELAKLGHTHRVVVADCGLPSPPGVPVVDLSVVFGLPDFISVVRALLGEIVVEKSWAASEVKATNPQVDHFLGEVAPNLTYISHEEFKTMLPHASLIIRTGEASAYANVIFSCGVPF